MADLLIVVLAGSFTFLLVITAALWMFDLLAAMLKEAVE